MQVSWDTSHFRLHPYETANLGSSFTYLCIVPTSAGTEERWFPDRFSSVREVMSQRVRGNSDRALFDRLRLLSLQNLKKRGEKEREVFSKSVWERRREGQEEKGQTNRDKDIHLCAIIRLWPSLKHKKHTQWTTITYITPARLKK